MDQFQIVNLTALVQPPDDGIISRTVRNDDQFKAVVFGFGAGQELSEHTASLPAVMQFLSGTADVSLGDEKMAASVGTWIHMPAGMPHSIAAKTPVVMLLILLK